MEPHPNISIFADEHIDVTFHSFNPHSGVAAVIVRPTQAKTGFYFIWVRFFSGDETRVDFDGNNPNQPAFLEIRTSHKDDTVKEIEVKRVRA